MAVEPFAWTPEGAVRVLDQTALPEREVYLELNTVGEVVDAIRHLTVRGAPAIGIVAAMGLVAGLRPCRTTSRSHFLASLEQATELLRATRPTAVNLGRAMDRMRRTADLTPRDGEALWELLRHEAHAIWFEDREMCLRIGEAGLPLVPDGATVLTHCNTGMLATGGVGTALAPVYRAHEAGRSVRVLVGETRPLMQGARLTAWELQRAGIPCTVMVDAAAGAIMRDARVEVVLVGADRVARNGDTANKIGTYSLAVLASHHGIPFYVCAPSSTLDPATPTGERIPIEQRDPGELLHPAGARVLNPAFDVTPAEYITGWVTDRGLQTPPFSD